MAEENEDQTTVDNAELESLRAGNTSKDRVITDLQQGKAVPAWLQQQMDAVGVETREDLAALLSKQGASTPDPEPKGDEKPAALDPTKYTDADGLLTTDGLGALLQDMRGFAGQEAEAAVAAAERSRALADEVRLVAEAADTAPESLIPGGDGDKEVLRAAIDGVVAKAVKTGVAGPKDVAAAREALAEWAGRVTDAEIARRTKEAETAAKKEPPAGSPGGGDGAPTPPKQEGPAKTPAQMFEQKREESRAEFQRRHTA